MWINKAHATEKTAIRTFSTVTEHVCFQIARSSKHAFANCACKQLFWSHVRETMIIAACKMSCAVRCTHGAATVSVCCWNFAVLYLRIGFCTKHQSLWKWYTKIKPFVIVIITIHGLNARWRPTRASPSSASCFGSVLSVSVQNHL